MIGSGYSSPSHAVSQGEPECSFCHLELPHGAEDPGLFLTSTGMAQNERPRTHRHCTKLLTELPEYKHLCFTSEDHSPVSLRCGGCPREKGYRPHDVDTADPDTAFVTFTKTDGTPGVIPYCAESVSRLDLPSGIEKKNYDDALTSVEKSAKNSRKAWEERMGHHNVSKANRSRGGSASGRSSEAGPSFSRQPENTGEGQDTGPDKGKGPATPLRSGTPGRIDVQTSDLGSVEPDRGSPDFRYSMFAIKDGIDLANLPSTLRYPPAGEDQGAPTALVPGPTTEMHATQEHHSQCCTCSSCCSNCVGM